MDASYAENTNTWFVELSTTPAAFRANAKADGVVLQQRFEFKSLWKGVSVKMAKKQLADLKLVEGVTAVYPVLTLQHAPTSGITPELATAINMTGANTVQSEMGFTGAGVKVAVMDTGVDYNHADLGGNGVASQDSAAFPNSRVTHGWDFVGDAFNADDTSPLYNPAATPDPRPDDCNGHGTHVAGIVGANGGVKGVAPGVTFGAYRVFGCNGSTTADIMLAAMERAAADGMHILNMSIGSAFMTWPQYPTAVGADALVDRGMVVVASIGNSGANGLYSAGAPGVGRKVIGVASFDNSHISALTFRTNPANTQMPYLVIADSKDAPTSGTTPEVVYVGRGCPGAALTPPGADDAYRANPSGKVALIDRGDCSFASKYDRAVAAGAVGVVIANNSAGLFAGGGIIDKGPWAVGISQADGNTLKSQITAGATTLTWTTDRINAVNPTGGLVSSFSSYGMTAELDLKPDIGAPGGLIRSTYPLEKQGGYSIISGTSMASPHVAGTAALLLQARPGTSPADVRTILQNNSQPVPYAAGQSLGAPVHRQGAGMVRIDRAIRSTAVVTPGKLALSYLDPTGPAINTRTLTIKNNGASAVSYTPSFAPAVGTNANTNAPVLQGNWPDVAFSASSVSVPAGGTATLDVTFDLSWAGAAANHHQYGGHVVLTPQGGGQALRVPAAGFRGDYLGVQVLVPTANEFPWLAKLSGGFYTRQAEGAIFTMTAGDTPYVLAHFRHQSRRYELTLLDAATGQPVVKKGPNEYRSLLMFEDYLPRNSTATSFFAFPWDGRIDQVNKNGKVVRRGLPEGQYKLQLRVLKALGTAGNAAHWETWTSPMFIVDQP